MQSDSYSCGFVVDHIKVINKNTSRTTCNLESAEAVKNERIVGKVSKSWELLIRKAFWCCDHALLTWSDKRDEEVTKAWSYLQKGFLTDNQSKNDRSKVPFSVSQQAFIYLTYYISDIYQKQSEIRKNQSKVHLRAEKRSHEGGKLSVYPTNNDTYRNTMIRSLSNAQPMHKFTFLSKNLTYFLLIVKPTLITKILYLSCFNAKIEQLYDISLTFAEHYNVWEDK